MVRKNLDICCLSETRIPDETHTKVLDPDSGEMIEIFTTGTEKSGLYGVGFAVSRKVAQSVIDWEPLNDRTARIRLRAAPNNITLFSVYAPTNQADEVSIDGFYRDLENALRKVSSKDHLVVGGDFNAQLGGTQSPSVGRFTLGRTCLNGDRLLQLLHSHRLLATNTFYQHKKRHLQTWISPDCRTRNQIDFILVRRKCRRWVLDSRSYWGVDISTDHALVMMRMLVRPLRWEKRETTKALDVKQLKDLNIWMGFKYHLLTNLEELSGKGPNVEETWVKLKEAIKNAAEESIPCKRRITSPRISQKTLTLSDQRKNARTNGNWTLARSLSKDIRRSVRADKTAYWSEIAADLESANQNGDHTKVFQIARKFQKGRGTIPMGMNDANGMRVTDVDANLNLWKEYYASLLNKERPTNRPVSDRAEAVWDVQTGPPEPHEIYRAINQLKRNKAAGPDGISAELLQAGGPTLTRHIANLFEQVWTEESIPKDWELATIIPIFKKGSRFSCGNYRGISLLSLLFKTLEAVIHNRNQEHVESITRENQAGFRPGRSCADQIFTLRALIELCYEFRQPQYIAFLDFSAAFDSLDRETLFDTLAAQGMPEKTCNILKAMYKCTRSQVRVNNRLTEEFRIVSGVRQGGVGSPSLFTRCIDEIMKEATSEQTPGVVLAGNIELHDLDFADNIGIIATDPQSLQSLIDKVSNIAAGYGLVLNHGKCKVLCTTHNEHKFFVNGLEIATVDEFNYLGSIVTSNGNVDKEVASRIGKAIAAYGSMKHLWGRKDISTKLKVRLYKALIRPVLLYSCESWPAKIQNLDRMRSFEYRCLRKICRD